MSHDLPPEPPPTDWAALEAMEPPDLPPVEMELVEPPFDDLSFMPDLPDLPDDPFPDHLFQREPFHDDHDVPPDIPWYPDEPPAPHVLQAGAADAVDSEWQWHDARLIGIERDVEGDADGEPRYEIGAMDVYTNIHSGELAGNYLPVASFNDIDVAATFYHQLQQQIHEQDVPVYEVPGFAEREARALNPDTESWCAATPEEYAAYNALRGLEGDDPIHWDDPPEPAIEPLLQTVMELAEDTARPEIEDQAAFQALRAIGIEAENFDPTKDPPPFYDTATSIAYWIGVFQPDPEDREHCVTSILSLGRSLETGETEAQLAPCVPGDWDKAYSAAEYLIDLAQKGDIERVFDAAEGMALATSQRELWDHERGMSLETETTDVLAAYSRELWEMEL